MLEFSYNWVDFAPPAPVIPVTLERPLSSDRAEVRGQIDTGSDITYIRAQVVSRLGLARVGEVDTLGIADAVDAKPFTSIQYSVRLVIATLFDELVEVAELPDGALPETELLIGRDVINQRYLGMWGPIMTGTLYEQAPQFSSDELDNPAGQ